MAGNNVTDHRLPVCDSMVIAPDADPFNGYGFTNCIFRGCSFQRITLMFTAAEYKNAMHVNWLRWISIMPDQQELPLDFAQQNQEPRLIEGEASEITESKDG